jgi:hypothetical protein
VLPNNNQKGGCSLIVALNISKENPLLKLFEQVDRLLEGYQETKAVPTRGRPKLFHDAQILKCMVYQAFYRIVSFRELEWRLSHDPVARCLIALTKVPDHTTLFLRAKELEESLYHEIYRLMLVLLQPDTRICMWDSTPMRASKYDREARKGKGTRLGWYVGYKLHAIVSQDLIPLAWDITTANVYDNQAAHLLDDVEQLGIFMLLADGAYDDSALFKKADEHGIHLVTGVNRRRAKSLDGIKDPYRRRNAAYMYGGLGQRFMKMRAEIERFFSILKVRYHLENPRLFGQNRYRRHVMWVIFSYLCDRLVDLFHGVKSAKAPWNR